MNVTDASEKMDARARPAFKQWSRYLVFALCASLYLLPFMRVIFGGTDEGTLLYGAVRIIHGQVFARDFFEVMGPGTFYWLATFFKLFGVTFLASRICLFFTSLGTGLALYFLSCKLCKQYQFLPSLILAGTSFGVIWPGISHHVDSNFFALLSVVCLVLWNTRPRKSLLIAAGTFAGITATIHLPKGILLICALLVWLWYQRKRTSMTLSSAGLLLGSYLSVVALMLAYFWSQGALSSLIYNNFIFPRQHYNSANDVVYAFSILKNYWTPWVSAAGGGVLAVSIACVLILPLMMIAALPLLTILVGIRSKWNPAPPVILLYWLCGWALWLSEIHRRDIEHLVFGAPLLLILCVHAVTESRRKFANITVQIIAITSVCLAGFNFFVVLAADAHSTETRVGKVVLFGSDPLLKFLDERIPAGENILIYPYGPTYYFLSATTNPTRYSFLQYNYNTPVQYQEVVDALEQQRVKYVIWDTTFATRAAENFPGLRPKSANDLIVEPYLETHYRLLEDDTGIHIMERK